MRRIRHRLPTIDATRRLARWVAPLLAAGDVIGLSGALGVGKTTFVRAVIAALGGAEEVPSPTFSLVQTYPLDDLTIWHFDLYRLNRPDEVIELGLDDALDQGVVLIEWPERLGEYLPAERLDIRFCAVRDGARTATLTGHGSWVGRLANQSLDSD